MARWLHTVASGVAFLALAGCGQSNPALGDWELDRGETSSGAVLVVQAAELEQLTFARDAIVSGDTRIEGSYVVEEGRVRFVRADGRGEHVIAVLPDDRIQVELPVGVTAVYKKAG